MHPLRKQEIITNVAAAFIILLVMILLVAIGLLFAYLVEPN